MVKSDTVKAISFIGPGGDGVTKLGLICTLADSSAAEADADAENAAKVEVGLPGLAGTSWMDCSFAASSASPSL